MFLHIAAILGMFSKAAYENRDSRWFLTDATFLTVIEHFNKHYRTPETYITEQDAMDEMVKTNTYEFTRWANGWHIAELMSLERYAVTNLSYDINQSKNIMKVDVIDTFLRRNMKLMDGDRNDCEKIAHQMNKDFFVYDLLVTDYVIST